ncbi:hypothetical protein Efla_002207 [Eimeria flavescens]
MIISCPGIPWRGGPLWGPLLGSPLARRLEGIKARGASLRGPQSLFALRWASSEQTRPAGGSPVPPANHPRSSSSSSSSSRLFFHSSWRLCKTTSPQVARASLSLGPPLPRRGPLILQPFAAWGPPSLQPGGLPSTSCVWPSLVSRCSLLTSGAPRASSAAGPPSGRGGGAPRGPLPPRPPEDPTSEALRKTALWCCCAFCCLCGVAFAFVPLYEAFCSATGYGGALRGAPHAEQIEEVPVRTRSATDKDEVITIDFASHCNLPWTFRPLQRQIKVSPGESALAFYRAKNLTSKPIIGMSLYHVMPPEAAQYFNKIQCFCFEEQMLNPPASRLLAVSFSYKRRSGPSCLLLHRSSDPRRPSVW